MVRRPSFKLLIIVLFLVAVIAGPLYILLPLIDDVHPEELDQTELEHQIHAEVNDHREFHGRDRITFDEALHPVARKYSERMATEGFFGHVDPAGATFRDRYAEQGYECEIEINKTHSAHGGENLAQTTYGDPVETNQGTERYTTQDDLVTAIVDGWMDSPEHRDNLLTDYWENHAIGVYITDDDDVYVTQNFC